VQTGSEDQFSIFTVKYKYYNTHTHPFNGPLSGTTQVGWYQKGKTNLDFTGARDSEWQWHHLGHMQVSTSLQTTTPAPHYSVFYRPDALPAAKPTASKAAKALKAYITKCKYYKEKTNRFTIENCSKYLKIFTQFLCSFQFFLQCYNFTMETYTHINLQTKKSETCDYHNKCIIQPIVRVPQNPTTKCSIMWSDLLHRSQFYRLLKAATSVVRPTLSLVMFPDNWTVHLHKPNALSVA